MRAEGALKQGWQREADLLIGRGVAVACGDTDNLSRCPLCHGVSGRNCDAAGR